MSDRLFQWLSPVVAKLNFSGVGLYDLPQWLSDMNAIDRDALEELREVCVTADRNHLTALEIPFQSISVRLITHLDLESNEMRVVPDCIRLLKRVEYLSLSHNNGLSVIPKWIGELTSLKVLRWGGNAVTSVPEELCQCSLLTHLYLYDNRLRDLPSALSALSGMEFLNIHRNELTEIPCCVLSWSNLQQLHAEVNQFSELPRNIDALWPHLTDLVVAENVLQELPVSIAKLSALRVLNAHHNRLREFPEELCTLPNIELLFLSDNPIVFLPQRLGAMQTLRELHVADCMLRSLPDVSGLQSLRVLRGGSNALTEFPTSLLHCTELELIDLHENDISQLPDAENWASVNQLSKIFLHQNRALRCLPMFLLYLPRPETVRMPHACPLPADIHTLLESQPLAVQSYLHELRRRLTAP